MNLGTVIKAFDTVMALRSAARRMRGDAPPEDGGRLPAAPGAAGGAIEARLTGVVVAALKEAFDRDHARLDLERAQLEEQRRRADEAARRADEAARRAEEAMRLELRRQAIERELARLRLVAGAALVGWIASVLLLVGRLGAASTASRAVLAAGWLLLLGALASAFTAQGRLGVAPPDAASLPRSPAAAASVWLLTGGLAVAAISLLF